MPDGLAKWTAADIPDQSGRVVVVTGANSGLGLVTARELARAGATVVLAVPRHAEGRAGGARRSSGEREVRRASTSPTCPRCARSPSGSRTSRVDVLINNAGVMAPPRRTTTDGFESQFGTNHLGHFALTGRCCPGCCAADAPRVVTLSSGAHRIGSIHFDDLQGERRYNNWLWYGQSKLANLMFCFELQKRATAAGCGPARASPRTPDTPGPTSSSPGRTGTSSGSCASTNPLLGQSDAMGALPTLFAATAPAVPGGSFIGPDGFMEQRGHPHIVTAAGKAYDEEAWRRLWEISGAVEGLTLLSCAGIAAVRAALG